MKTVDQAIPNDIYVDVDGKLWRCVGYCKEPTVSFEEVEPLTAIGAMQPNKLYVEGDHPDGVKFLRQKKDGGVAGLMFKGWSRVFRKGEA